MNKQFHRPIKSADLDIPQKQSAIALSRPNWHSTEQLFGTAREVVIAHEGEEYRLCITRNEKLILIK